MRLLILLALVGACLSLRERANELNRPVTNAEQEYLYQQKQHIFNQVLDHYNYQNKVYWSQRYWSVQDYFNPKIGPVLLFICGQYTCSGVPKGREWVTTLAQKLQGLILVVEHRFYGKSMPFDADSLQLENMKYLNSEQALSDLVYFIQQVNINKMFKVNGNPWIPIGGSYPGALSAWLRYKYPHLSLGAIASSAVVLAIENFPQFDHQIYVSSNKSGSYCSNALSNSNNLVQEILKSDKGQQFKNKFEGGKNLKNDEFMFFWADSMVLGIQYGNRTNLCNALKAKTPEQQLEILVKNAQQHSEVYEYSSYYLSNITFQHSHWVGARSWYYQSCTQFGFWQTPNSEHPMRSSWLNIQFYRRFCKDSFGVDLWPGVDRKNIEYGGLNLKAFNLLMSNGEQDPWRWASLQQNTGNIISRVANCTNCAHCADLYTPQTTDSDALKKIRNEQYLRISDWIEDYWRKQKKTSLRSWFLSNE